MSKPINHPEIAKFDFICLPFVLTSAASPIGITGGAIFGVVSWLNSKIIPKLPFVDSIGQKFDSPSTRSWIAIKSIVTIALYVLTSCLVAFYTLTLLGYTVTPYTVALIWTASSLIQLSLIVIGIAGMLIVVEKERPELLSSPFNTASIYRFLKEYV